MKNLIKLGTVLKKNEQQSIKGGFSATGGGDYNVVCLFPNGEWWEGNATTQNGAWAMELHCENSGGEVSDIR